MVLDLIKNKEIRNKIIFTLIILIIFRIGCALPVPFINSEMLEALFGSGSLIDYADMLTGGALSQCSVFALGITPFINASIVMQLLGIAFERLRELQTGDQTDKEKYETITKIVGTGFALIMSVGYYFILRNYEALEYTSGKSMIVSAITICVMFCFGSLMCSWFSTIIDEIGVGSGMSLLIFAGIITKLSSLPSFFSTVISAGKSGDFLNMGLGIFLVLFVLFAIIYICYMSGSEIKIPVTYANKKATSTIPLRIMFGGVLPIIFATTILSIPQTIMLFFKSDSKIYEFLEGWDSKNWIYIALCAILIFLMTAYYTSTQFNADEIAQNLKKHGAVIPGIRPGIPTAEYLRKNVNRIVPCGALVLCIIAIVPMIVAKLSSLSVSFGGTSLIIICSVALEVIRNLSAKMADYKYKDKNSIWGRL